MLEIGPPESKEQEEGFLLPLVLLVSLILGASLMAMGARAWLGVTGSIRVSQARQAREIAEAGIAKTLDSLNSDYAYLLIKNLDDWGNNSFVSSVCPNSELSTAITTTANTSNPTGRYVLEDYRFTGSPFYGGQAILRMRGERLKGTAGDVASTAIVEQVVNIKPKDCNSVQGESTVTSGFPGLLGQFIDMGNNDIKGKLSGNVFCLQCYSGTDYDSLSREEKEVLIDAGPRSEIDGDIVMGPLDLPPVPTPPDLAYATAPAITGSVSIVAGSTDPAELLNGACVVGDEEPVPVTHCVIDSIDLAGTSRETVSVDTTAGPVRIYVTGAKAVFKGKAALVHTPSTATPSELGIFGRPVDPTNAYIDQEVLLAGGATTTSLWAYFPDGNVGINGGAKESAVCDADGECTGGDIFGAIWSKTWGGAKCEGCLETGGGSASTVAQLVVPANMGTELFNNYGAEYALGIRDYVAVGVTGWRSFWKASGN